MKRWWSAAPIRVRLTAWYSAALLLMMIVYAVATFVAVRHEFFEQFDEELQEDFDAAQAQLVRTADGRIVGTGEPGPDTHAEADRTTEVWSVDGRPLFRSNAPGSLPALASGTPGAGARIQTVEGEGERWRAMAGPVAIGGAGVILRVARSEERLRRQLREILVVLVLGLPLVVVLAGGGGYILARGALAPIDQMSADARRISAERLHERLSVSNQHDEIGRLAAVINGTLARLESSFEQLRRFTADASHELRTPLAVIRSIGEVALGEPRTPAEYKDALGSMLEEVDRLTHLVDTLLRLSYGDAGTVRLAREHVDAGQLTREAVSSLAVLAEERNQRLSVDGPSGLMTIADRLVLREAITNLVDNAIKYSPDGSRIEARAALDAQHVVITVTDEGPGIAAEHRERIFDRFFRVDEGRSRESGGTGLGLAIARWAVEANGGRLSVEPAARGGSTFRIVLPLQTTPPGTTQSAIRILEEQL